MKELSETGRIKPTQRCSNSEGQIKFDWVKTIWVTTHGLLGLLGLILFPQLDAAVVFLVITSITLCFGHSIGMHRLLIHKSFETSKTMRRVLVWLGALVGMAGPIGMIYLHDMRDWHQRQSDCPVHPAHRTGFWCDAIWQLCCEFKLTHPPKFVLEDDIRNDRVLLWIERYWMVQQVPVAILLYLLGGWAFVLWGVCLRVFVSLFGHFAVGHYAHQQGGGHRPNQKDFSVKAQNLKGLGLITFGENWHGNHHADPTSANLAGELGQLDPGFWFIKTFERLGLVWNVKSEPEFSYNSLKSTL